VISGFLITGILLESLEQPNYLRNFYMRRVLRIFPVYYLALIVCLFILPQVSSLHFDADYYYNNQFYMWTYLQNWLFIFKPPGANQSLLHTWSLAVEEQFYLFWPLLILILRKPKLILAFSIILFLAVSILRYIVWDHQVAELQYASLFTFTRIDGLCIGASVCILMRINPNILRNNLTYIVLLFAIINFAFYFINTEHAYSLPYLAFVGYSTFAMLFGLLVFEAASGRSAIIQILFNNRLMKFFGKISYGFYVYHWPIYILLYPWVVKMFQQNANWNVKLVSITSAVLVTIIAIVISMVSYEFFEKPLLKLKKNYA